ncbi:helix-turn-helix domain-containing protein [Cellulomonas composti]|uniref:HTH cro/C1-type domain-containing protein n=1 Tax=Cellulomonas composti TaxID=266130 RepID=A0A511J930_9CELL|nr:helix-turn-helix transcriptional regulator [Cellulomonas composti]GEL94497.1 hypothetical protein CCO02nite_11550 [Cellulomonas composti]
MPWTEQIARELGSRIRERRAAEGLSQETLAHRAGITKNQVQLIEAGRGSAREGGPASNPRVRTLFGIADALHVTPDRLLSGLSAAGDQGEPDQDGDATGHGP